MPSASEQEKIDRLIFAAIYRKIEAALDALQADDKQEAAVLLRQILPRGYKWTFHKEKEKA
jgi:hypothetical protein